jgi:hypothetical protein
MSDSNLNPIRLLHRLSQDSTVETEGARILWSAMVYLDDAEKDELVGKWIEGRL